MKALAALLAPSLIVLPLGAGLVARPSLERLWPQARWWYLQQQHGALYHQDYTDERGRARSDCWPVAGGEIFACAADLPENVPIVPFYEP